jgi:hypothetical protein
VLVVYSVLGAELRNEERGGDDVRIVERIPAHYETQEVEDIGRVYKWCPEQVVLECGACCARKTFKRSSLLTSIVACECGARCSESVREELIVEQLAEDERLHPWRYWQTEENTGIPI